MDYQNPDDGYYIVMDVLTIHETNVQYIIARVNGNAFYFEGNGANHLWVYEKDSDSMVSLEIDTDFGLIHQLQIELMSTYGINKEARGRGALTVASKEIITGRIGG